MVEVDTDTNETPREGEVMVVTQVGGFLVRGRLHDVIQRLSAEEWPPFELAESGDQIVIRSSQVVALRAGTGKRRSTIGFHPR